MFLFVVHISRQMKYEDIFLSKIDELQVMVIVDSKLSTLFCCYLMRKFIRYFTKALYLIIV